MSYTTPLQKGGGVLYLQMEVLLLSAQEAAWASRPVWTDADNLGPHWDSNVQLAASRYCSQ
jgi:hypothetical protein